MNIHSATATARAALYLRVSTARQAEHDISIPDQKRQGEAYCEQRGYQLVETFVEPGATATNDKRPEFQRMIEAGTSKPAPFDIVVVHSFSRFFRDHFEMEFYVRKLAKNSVKLVSITQEMGDDPMHQMMRQIMALFDEYQSKENAKHVLRAMNENARQGFWNGARPPIGYRIVAAEQRGSKIKKKLEIDPLHADTVRLIYRLYLEGDGTSGAMGVKAIATYLNERGFFTRDGGKWGLAQIHAVLRVSPPTCSRRSPARLVNGYGSTVAAITATTCALWRSASRLVTMRFASWDRSQSCCERWLRLPA